MNMLVFLFVLTAGVALALSVSLLDIERDIEIGFSGENLTSPSE